MAVPRDIFGNDTMTITHYKDAERNDYIIQNWVRNRNTIEFLGIWEYLTTPF